MEIIIIGGGLAGGVCAKLLRKEDFEVTVVEKNNLGGLLRSIELGNYRFDFGPHLFYHSKNNKQIYNFISSFVRTYPIKTYAKCFPEKGDLNKPHDYPLTERNINLWNDAKKIKRELRSLPRKKNKDNFASFVESSIGKTLFDRYVKNYTEKKWGISTKKLEWNFAPKRISFAKEERPFFGNAKEYYPVGGFNKFIENIFDGVNVLYDETVGAVFDNSKVNAIILRSGKKIKANIFISTVAPDIFLSENLRFRSTIILGIVCELKNREYLFGDRCNWGYFYDGFSFARITEHKSIDKDFQDLKETILTFEFPCFYGDSLWRINEETLLKIAREFFKLNALSYKIIEFKIVRYKNVYPLPVKDEISKFDEMRLRLEKFKNLYFVGHLGRYRYDFWTKDVFEDSFNVVKTIIKTFG